MVVHGEGTQLALGVTDKEQSVQVAYTGILPVSSARSRGIVTEGTFGADGVLVADSVLAKHDGNHMLKEVADSLKARGVWQQN